MLYIYYKYFTLYFEYLFTVLSQHGIGETFKRSTEIIEIVSMK